MKRLIVSALVFILFSCQKKDIHYTRSEKIKCDASEQSPLQGFLLSHGGGFVKSYYPSGLVKTVVTKVYSNFGAFDSIQYKFDYAGNSANATASKQSYLLGTVTDEDNNTTEYIYPNPCNPTSSYSFKVVFDSRLNAVSAGTTTFRYDSKGKLTGYNEYTIVYDSKGNIIRPNGPLGNGATGVAYEYDYTKTATQQLYYTTGFMTNEMYNLMEIMDWIPVRPKNLRIAHAVSFGGNSEEEYIAGTFRFANHKLNRDGLLISFDEIEFQQAPAITTWSCLSIKKIHERK